MTTWQDQGSRIGGARMQVLIDAANELTDARRTGRPVADLDAGMRPINLTEAYAIQDTLIAAYGTIGGWKVGAPDREATPFFAPMPAVWIAAGGATVRALRYRGIEAEAAFLLGRDLPPRRDKPYTRDEVLDAVASCHPAIELLESGLLDPMKVDRLTMIADLQMHGGFIYGAAAANWREIDWTTERVTLALDGSVRVERTGSNTAGDLLRLLPWLANEGAGRTGGLRAGQWITTGSWTGNTIAEEHTSVDVQFARLGRVTMMFAPEQELEKGLPGTVRSFT